MNVVRAFRVRPLRAALPAWLAVLALALLPTLSRALSAPVPLLSPAVAADLCRSDSGDGLHHVLESCAHCALSAHAALPPRAIAAPLRVPRASPARPAARAGRPDGPAAGAAEARAPPPGIASAA